MKRKWIYGSILIVLIFGLVYLLWNRNEDKEKNANTGEDKITVEDDAKLEDKEDEELEESPEEAEEVRDPSEFPEIVVGEKLPDFTLQSLKGENINLRELEGKIVILNFWGTWCPYCVQEMPDLNKLDGENEDLIVVAVNVNEEKSIVEEYINDGGYDFQVVLDKEGQTSMDYMATNLPSTYFINEEGLFVGRVVGGMDYDSMLEAVEMTREF